MKTSLGERVTAAPERLLEPRMRPVRRWMAAVGILVALSAAGGFASFPLVQRHPRPAGGLMLVLAAVLTIVPPMMSRARADDGPSIERRWLVVLPLVLWLGIGLGLVGGAATAAPAPGEAVIEPIDTHVHQLSATYYPLPDGLLAATNATAGVLPYVRPLDGDRLLVTASPKAWDVDAATGAGVDGSEPDVEAMEAMRAVVGVVEVVGDGLEQVDRVVLPGVSRVRGMELSSDRRELYVSDIAVADGCVRLEVHRFALTLEPLAVSQPQRLFASDRCLEGELAHQQAGGQLAFDPSGELLVTVGDFDLGGSYQQEMEPGRPEQLEPPATYGAVVRLDVATGAAQLVASGLRNAQGIAVDPADGRTWITEHGPAGGDELNLLREGADYGWPNVSYGIPYGPGLPEGEFDVDHFGGRHQDYEQPHLVWASAIAPSQLVVYRGDDLEFPAWEGDLLVGSLRGVSLHRIRFDGDRVLIDETITIGRRLRDVAMDDRGRIAMTTDSGELVRLTLRPAPASP